jgi:hypothetical protein
MGKLLTMAMLTCLLAGCDDGPSPMSRAEDPVGRYADQIAVAARVLEQRENWADRAEWEVQRTDEGWKVIAWRIEHPEKQGSDRYVPWGYSVIELDRRLVAIHYSHAKR